MTPERAGIGSPTPTADALRTLLRGAAGLLGEARRSATPVGAVLRLGGCALAVERPEPDPAVVRDGDRRVAAAFSSAKRRAQFLLGRAAANRALAALRGPSVESIGRGAGGEPLWPSGWAGSISHSGDTAVAVVHAAGAGPVGIDVELVQLRDVAELLPHVLSAEEHAALAVAGSGAELPFYAGFSLKEAVVKAMLPVAGPPRGFRDIALDGVHVDRDRVLACGWRHGGLAGFAGCVATADVVCSLAVLAAGGGCAFERASTWPGGSASRGADPDDGPSRSR